MASQNYASAFDKSIDKHILLSFDEWDSVIPQIFHASDTKGRIVQHQGWTGYGLPVARLHGEEIAQLEVAENYGKRYTMRSVGGGDAIPIEDVDDDPAGILTQGSARIAGGLANSFTDYIETDAANFLINGFSVTTGMPDGDTLFSTSHNRSRSNTATTDSNRPSSGVDLSVSTLQSAITNIRTQKAPNGRPISNRPRVLWYHPQLDFQVQQILKGRMEPYTMDNNENIIKKYNIIPVEMPYLEESGAAADAWGLVGELHFLYFIWRQRYKSRSAVDGATNTYQTWGTIRYDLGPSDYRGTYGSPGA